MSAVFSPCRTWRYSLTRLTERGVALDEASKFHKGEQLKMPTVAFIGLNPSTADETKNDPTVRRCAAFADRWGYGRMVMLNLFAFRSTDPRALYHEPDPVGPDNDYWLGLECGAADLVVCAWGTHGELVHRGEKVRDTLRLLEVRPHVFGLTKGGHPKHPLYLKRDLQPVPW